MVTSGIPAMKEASADSRIAERRQPGLRLLVLGATGGTGRALLEQGRKEGHQITALVRSPQKLAGIGEGVTVRPGDPHSVAELRAALPGHDAVLSALGPPGLGRTTLLGDCAPSTVAAMQAAGVRRLLVVSAAVLPGRPIRLAAAPHFPAKRGKGLGRDGTYRGGQRSELDHCAAAAADEWPGYGTLPRRGRPPATPRDFHQPRRCGPLSSR